MTVGPPREENALGEPWAHACPRLGISELDIFSRKRSSFTGSPGHVNIPYLVLPPGSGALSPPLGPRTVGEVPVPDLGAVWAAAGEGIWPIHVAFGQPPGKGTVAHERRADHRTAPSST